VPSLRYGCSDVGTVRRSCERWALHYQRALPGQVPVPVNWTSIVRTLIICALLAFLFYLLSVTPA